MINERKVSRRSAMGTMAAGIAAASTLPTLSSTANETNLKGNIKQSVSKWCFNQYIEDNGFEAFCKTCADLGLVGIDLVGESDWKIMKEYGLVSTMNSPGAGSIAHGCNEKDIHSDLLEQFKKNIGLCKEYGFRNIITFSGNRHGMSDEEGLENSTIVLKEAAKMAEDAGVIINMELLNSKVDHPGYMCDNSPWGIELCKRVDSPNFKLLYDIYHMQIMEGDIIRTIQNNHQYFGHYHTGGNPGRRDIDESQELKYEPIMKAIAETEYDGFVAHEFIPKNGIDSLKEAIEICDV